MAKINIKVVIPAHLASLRFPEKVLFPIFDLPMIEHVRRRAKLCSKIDEVFVATCDEEIAAVVNKNNGDVDENSLTVLAYERSPLKKMKNS